MSDLISKHAVIAALKAEHLESRGEAGRSDGDEAYDMAVTHCVAAIEKLEAVPAPERPTFDFAAHLQRQREFSERTFGPGKRTQGVVDHIRKELNEILAKPDDLSEWADVVILGLDGFWRAGATPQQIIDALVAKQTRNEGRTWPDWRTQPTDKAIEHDRTGEVAPETPPPLAERPESADDVAGALAEARIWGDAGPPPQVVSLHRCRICGTRWLLWPAGLAAADTPIWNLLDKYQRPGQCCDNAPMEEPTIEHLRDLPLAGPSAPTQETRDRLIAREALTAYVHLHGNAEDCDDCGDLADAGGASPCAIHSYFGPAKTLADLAFGPPINENTDKPWDGKIYALDHSEAEALSASSPAVLPRSGGQETQHWGVDVRRNGDTILTIESNCLSGKPDFTDEEARIIRAAGEHLIAFIGGSSPFPPEGAQESELDRLVADYKHIEDNDGEHRISDLVWLINELIYERDQRSERNRQ